MTIPRAIGHSIRNSQIDLDSIDCWARPWPKESLVSRAGIAQVRSGCNVEWRLGLDYRSRCFLVREIGSGGDETDIVEHLSSRLCQDCETNSSFDISFWFKFESFLFRTIKSLTHPFGACPRLLKIRG